MITDQPSLRRRQAGTWIRLAFLAAVLAFGGLFIANRWSELQAALGRMNWFAALGSVAVGGLGLFAGMLGWREMLADLGGSMPVSAGSRVFFVGQLGKYLPGSVWSFLAQAQMAKERQVSRKATLTASFIAAALSVAVGSVFAVVLLPIGSHEAMRRYWWVALTIPLCVVALHPRIVGPAIDGALRLARREPLDQRPSYRGMLRSAGWYVVGWVLLGLHAWLLVVGIGGTPGLALPTAVGGFALASCLGLIFIPAPAGAGIRDVALSIALSPVLGSAAALAVALVSRVILTTLDFGLAGIAWLASRHVSADPAALKPPPDAL